MVRKEKWGKERRVIGYWPVVLLPAAPLGLPSAALPVVAPVVAPPAVEPLVLPVPAVEPPRSPVPAVVPPVLAVPVVVLPVPAESVLMLASPVPLLPPVVVPEASVEVPSLPLPLPPQEASRVALSARAAKARGNFRVRMGWTNKGKNVVLIRGSHRQHRREYCGFSGKNT